MPCTTTLKQLGSMPVSSPLTNMHVTGSPSLSFIAGEFSEMQRVIGEMLFRVLPSVKEAVRLKAMRRPG